MTTTKTQKIIIWSLPIAAAVGFAIYLVYGYLKEKSGITPNGVKTPAPNKPDGKTEIKDDGSAVISFPLKKGITNDYVKQLQDILDVTPQSGYFGDLTLAALKEQTGKTQIDSLSDLNSTISSIISKDALIPEKINKAKNIIDTYNKLKKDADDAALIGEGTLNGDLLFIKNTTLYSDGFVFYMSANKTLNLNDYSPKYVAENGDLILACNSGDNFGVWSVDPRNITISIKKENSDIASW